MVGLRAALLCSRLRHKILHSLKRVSSTEALGVSNVHTVQLLDGQNMPIGAVDVSISATKHGTQHAAPINVIDAQPSRR